ncbi:hypothetical protein [Burkholderia pseudomallei]|uniref:hypothetical protein n=1 Tax=Burkholderia pseudomallei TaxID=28450 RepID=UPI00053774E5|nr:hypothetical protein [Burkholderia pseudomallei]KGW49456.1 hypothetical protein Y049_3015 [Burkholderia pseudomallei MSHR684]KGU72712.1 hypothetical protein X883_1448 [Burkholderia pseudomallei MSHR4304]KGV29484.1 hypothetical protein X884_4092 [Burkholderia pseudomallei MSHR4308]KGW92025.1 hypothetical protein Y048_4500 [Burkholderia pseudomallei MSHR456]KGX09886.1 hypothetical protein X896_5584 [Burkholderia pseudomallei ABCPW 1]
MTAMINGYPTELELRERIERQISRRGASDTVVLIWHGYLTGLFEWGLIELDVFERLSALLPTIGRVELIELSLGEPITPEMQQEIDELEEKNKRIK